MSAEVVGKGFTGLSYRMDDHTRVKGNAWRERRQGLLLLQMGSCCPCKDCRVLTLLCGVIQHHHPLP